MEKCKCFNTVAGMGHDPICDCECHKPQEQKEDWENIDEILKAMKMFNGKDFCALCGFSPVKFVENIRSLKAKWEKQAVEKYLRDNGDKVYVPEAVKLKTEGADGFLTKE